MPALVAKAEAPTYGACRSGARFSNSSNACEILEISAQATPRETPISNRWARSDLSARVGISETRLALPQRSPSPFNVPWICLTPARAAASELATALSVSLCA